MASFSSRQVESFSPKEFFPTTKVYSLFPFHMQKSESEYMENISTPWNVKWRGINNIRNIKCVSYFHHHSTSFRRELFSRFFASLLRTQGGCGMTRTIYKLVTLRSYFVSIFLRSIQDLAEDDVMGLKDFRESFFVPTASSWLEISTKLHTVIASLWRRALYS